jgi:hypothetical protein
MAPMLVNLLTQWLSAAGMIWLVWWAAQSRDALAWRVLAGVLVVVPALAWPVLTLMITMNSYQTVSNRALMFGILSASVTVLRALLLITWAITSKDRLYLRIGGGVIAMLSAVELSIAALASLMLA